MPELPEVEVSVRFLRSKIIGLKVESVSEHAPQTWRRSLLPSSGLIGFSVSEVLRRGKYIIIRMSNGFFWTVHLRMSGQMAVMNSNDELNEYERCSVFLSGGLRVGFLDIRRFGVMYLNDPDTHRESTGISKLGYDPFLDEEDLSSVALDMSRHKGMPIKSYLLSQTGICGLGNIYVDEVLFACGVLPSRLCADILLDELSFILSKSKEILMAGIEHGGTTVYTFKSSAGKSGSFQNFLKAYGKKGQPCVNCSSEMLGCKIGGRSTVYCGECQK